MRFRRRKRPRWWSALLQVCGGWGFAFCCPPAIKLNTANLSIPCNWTKENDEETRHPTHRRYLWWSGMLKGAVAGASPTGPWTDRQTGVRTPDHDERQPWRIPLDRPCLLPKMAVKSSRRHLARQTQISIEVVTQPTDRISGIM